VAAKLGLKVARVPAYSPHGVAEYAVGLLLALNRKIHKAYNRVRDLNFSLEGMMGFDLIGKTVGVIGTGKIGTVFSRIMKGFGCNIIAYDMIPNEELTREKIAKYVNLSRLFRESDIISLHAPLLPATRHIIDKKAISKMKKGVFLINTGRGALIDSKDLVEALKSGCIGAAGLDVYEEEEGVFFRDLSNQVLRDDALARLLSFPNVIISSHQAFLTKEAMENISQTTLQNISDFKEKKVLVNEVHVKTHFKQS
jgi:D-lactate dehydrogenase